MLRRPTIFSAILFLGLHFFAVSHTEAAFPWYYEVTGPGGTDEITIEEPGEIVYVQFDALKSDYVWGNVRIDFDPALLECVSIEETPYANGFWTAWITTTAEPAYGGGGSLYYYDSTGYGSDWAHYWVDHYGPLTAGPSGSYDNTLGIIRLYVITDAGGLNGSVPLRIGFRVKQTGTAVFHTYASAGEFFSWRLEDLPYRHVSTVKIVQKTCVEPPSGMIGWWPGDGNANDIIGGNSGTMQNGAMFASGLVGQAFSLDGVNDYVDLGVNAGNFGSGDFSFDVWVKFHSLSGEQVIIEKYIERFNALGSPGWGITKLSNNALAFFGQAGLPAVAVPGGITPGTWHHVAVTRGGSQSSVYFDGNLIAAGAITLSGNVDSTASLKLGHRGNPQDTPGSWDGRGFYLNGLIDEVSLYDRALTSAEISALYNAGSAGKCESANRSPVAEAGPDQTVEQTSCAGAGVTLDGSSSSDPDGDALTYSWTWPGGSAEGVSPTVTLPYGATTVTLTVDDGKGGTATDEVVITVADTTAPVLNATLSPNVLWPPNHKYVTVTPSVTVQDACVGTTDVELLSASSNEPDNGLGDGDAANDIVVSSDGTLSLRAERSGTGSGRTYTIVYQATDAGGNSATAAATVNVPHDRK